MHLNKCAPASKSWTSSPRNGAPVPCGPTLARSWIREGTQSTGYFYKWNMITPQDPPHNWKFPASSQDHCEAGQNILQVLVHPPHIPVRLRGDNDSDLE